MKNEVKIYYAKAPKESLKKFLELESIIGSVLKDYHVVLSYGVPTFVFKSKKVAGIGAYKEFVSLYPLGNELIKKYEVNLKDYKTSKGAIQFANNEPLPKELIKKIIRDRMKLVIS